MIEISLMVLFMLWAFSRSGFTVDSDTPTIESVTWEPYPISGFPKSFTQPNLQKGVIGIQQQTENMTDGTTNPLQIWRNYVKYGQDPSTPLAGTFTGQNGKQNAITSANGWLNANAPSGGGSIAPQSIQTPSPSQENVTPTEEQIREVTQPSRLASDEGTGLMPLNSGSFNAVGGYALQDPLIR